MQEDSQQAESFHIPDPSNPGSFNGFSEPSGSSGNGSFWPTNTQAPPLGFQSDFQGQDLRNGDNLRDLYYQSPYLRRFTSNRLAAFSNEKDSANKENVSPLSGGAGLSATNQHHRSTTGTSVGTTSGNTTMATPINRNMQGLLFSAGRYRSPTFPSSLMNTQARSSGQSNDNEDTPYGSRLNGGSAGTTTRQEEDDESPPLEEFKVGEPATVRDFAEQCAALQGFHPELEIQYQTIEEVQSDIGEVDNNSDTQMSSFSNFEFCQNPLLASDQADGTPGTVAGHQHSALRLRSRPVLQERSPIASQFESGNGSIRKRINFSHSKASKAQKRNKKANFFTKQVLQLR